MDEQAVVSIAITSETDYNDIVLTVQPRGALQVIGNEIVYRGPLRAGQRKQFAVTVLSSAPGDQHLTVSLRSDVPSLNSSLDVVLPGFVETTGHRGDAQIRLVLHSVPLRQALRQIAAAGDLDIEIADSVGDQPVTVDFSDGISAAEALKAVARMGECRLEEKPGGYVAK